MTRRTPIRQLLARRTLALVLAGGRGSRLKQLTDRRAKPAVYFGGKFRIIDFALSNCLNSGIRRIGVITQYKSHSLLRHLQRGWAFLRSEMNEFVDLLPAQQRVDEESWYRGTADAVYQNLDILRRLRPEYVVVLAGDHVYKMDYALHARRPRRQRRASAPSAASRCRATRPPAFGVMAVDDERRRSSTSSKSRPTRRRCRASPTVALASMGIYVFNADYLYDELRARHRRPDVEPRFRQGHHPARGAAAAARWPTRSRCSCVATTPDAEPYWRDVGTDRRLLGRQHRPDRDRRRSSTSTTRNWPIWTYQEQLPPAKFVHRRRRPARHGDRFAWSRAAASSPARRVARSLLFSSVRVHLLLPASSEAVLLPDVEVGRACPAHQGGDRSRLPHSRRAWWSARTRSSTPGASIAPTAGVVLITRDMLAAL